MDIDEATHFVLEKVLFPSGGGSGGGRGSGSGYTYTTMWSVNDGLSRNPIQPVFVGFSDVFFYSFMFENFMINSRKKS